ncbi:MAG: hypothetical protein JNL38_26190 [Myxococcales bacterium]|nr:hypothetical protein [Myxococcales bacterium]
MRALPSWVFASFVAAATAACSLSLGSDSAGENGVMRFEYQSSQCTFGCDLERPALEGSAVSIAAKGGDVDSHFNFVFEPSDLAAVQEQTESCSCSQRDGRSGATGGVELTCKAGETKSCTRKVDLQTRRSGDGKLSLRDARGVVVDQIPVKVRAAARIDLRVRAGKDSRELLPDASGAYVVTRGDKVELEAKVFDATGAQVVFTQHGVGHEYSDKTVLAPDTSVLLGATDVEYVSTGKAGEATVTVKARGAEAKAAFRVVP